MKKITFALMMISSIAFAQKQYPEYTNLWKEVAHFESKSLPKSALKVVDKIYKKAQKQHNTPQIVKAFLYQSKYAMILEEEAMLKIVQRLKEQINQHSFPTKNIFENVLANMYWQYYQQNRWKFHDRTKTAKKLDEIDFRTWDLKTLFAEIHTYFQKSLEDAEQSQQFPLEHIKALLHIQKESEKYQPTLYDFLSYNALSFYKSSENSLPQPEDHFEIDDANYLSSYKYFIKINFSTQKHLSLQKEALSIYQNLLRFHSENNNTEALIVADLERIKFVKNNAVFKNKEELFLKALRNLKSRFSTSDFSTLFDFEIAKFLVEQTARSSNDIDKKYVLNRAKAHDICQEAVQKFPKSLGAEKCKLLINQIEEKNIDIRKNSYVPIGRHSKINVYYQNIDRLYFQVYKISQRQKEKFIRLSRKNKLSFLKKLKIVKSFERQLVDKRDYMQHSTELLIPPMSRGRYITVVSGSPKLKMSNVYSYYMTQVTNISLIEKETNFVFGYQVLDRITGQPLSNAKIYIKDPYKKKYNTAKVFTSDKKGMIQIDKKKEHNSYIETKVVNGDDVAYFGDNYIRGYYKKEEVETKDDVNIFIDRSIYRPGQTVYFKGIAFQKNYLKRTSKVIPNEIFEVELFNDNYESQGTLELKTNEFGSFSGSFVLPKKGLMGRYFISVKYELAKSPLDRINFSVEEYKRPKFETLFNPVQKTYQLNDNITVLGEAKAYAGSAISNAKVVYKVRREVKYPRWCYGYFPNRYADVQEIVHGTTTTDEQGNFTIDFQAVPDKKVLPEQQPIFSYAITADITDVNGETRTAKTTVRVGYQALELQIDSSGKIIKPNTLEIAVKAKTLNGVSVENKGKISIYKLRAPDRVLKEKMRNEPDIPMPQEEFEKYFPHTPYTKNESSAHHWENGKLMWQGDYQSEKTIEFTPKKLQKWQIGKYRIEVESQDRFGQKVVAKRIIDIEDFKADKVSDNKLFSIMKDKKSYKKGENIKVKIGTASKELILTLSVERKGKITETKIVTLNNEVKEFSFPMYQSDIAGFAIHYDYVFYDSFNRGTLIIPIKEEKEKLEIETQVFRDKIQPGQQEKWSFQLKNTSKKDVVAEFLASMYDISLDQFRGYNRYLKTPTFERYYSSYSVNSRESFTTQYTYDWLSREYYRYPMLKFNRFNWFGFYFANSIRNRLVGKAYGRKIMVVKDEEKVEETAMMNTEESLAEVVLTEPLSEEAEVVEDIPLPDGYVKKSKPKPDFSNVKIRKNFDETAFFYPHLKTDKHGNISFEFTTPEALTTWKLQLMAHTKTMGVAHKILKVKTQKELMVVPNAPRFLRQGDKIDFMVKVANVSDKKLSGKIQLELTDAITGTKVNTLFENKKDVQDFVVKENGTTFVKWQLSIPDEVQAVQYKVVAKSGNFSDGEQNVLPILTNRKLVTETMPLWLTSKGSKTFTFKKLKNNTSKTLQHQRYTLEMTSNPAWYAVQSLPYLIEIMSDCNEKIFARLYANALGTHIVNSKPIIKKVFDQWANSDELISNLEKNQELKEILIEETPWLRKAQSETEQKKRIALLFRVNTMKYELENSLKKLQNNQNSDGSWSWFSGGYPSRWTTQHIVGGLGHLKKLGVPTSSKNMVRKALNYLDAEFVEEYKEIKRESTKMSYNQLSASQLYYLYLRSFYPDYKMSAEVKKIQKYYLSQIEKYWAESSLYGRGLMSMISFRAGKKQTAKTILKSLRENSVYNEEMGMYWKANTAGYFYYQAPIETQALMIEAFAEIENDVNTVDKLKMWLLKNKQTNRWKTTKATTEAVYALLLQGSNWLEVDNDVTVEVGSEKVIPSKDYKQSVSAGTGYYKTSWNAQEINSDKATIKVSKKGDGIIWGGVYWQYFEDLDKISSSKTSLKISKKLFLKKDTSAGKQLVEITKDTPVKVGDLVTSRIEISVDRPMEFVHLKDMRASGLEPINVLSSYKWQDGLGYYQSTRDTATNFFFDRLPKGVYVFEYDLRVNNAGTFSNGIATIQCAYAPEFSSHSKGEQLKVQSLE